MVLVSIMDEGAVVREEEDEGLPVGKGGDIIVVVGENVTKPLAGGSVEGKLEGNVEGSGVGKGIAELSQI